MPRWKLRSPDIFPILYSRTVLHAHETRAPALLRTVRNLSEARTTLDHFREWRRNLRDHPSGGAMPAGRIEGEHRITTRTREAGGLVELWVEIKPKLDDCIARCNPGLIDGIR